MKYISALLQKASSLKLRTQLLITFIFLSLLILGANSVFFYSNILQMLQKRSEETTIGSFKQVEFGVETFLNKVNSLSKSFLMDPSVEAYLENREINEMKKLQLVSNIRGRLSETISNYPYIQSIYLLPGDERVLGVTVNAFFLTDQVKDYWFYNSSVYQQSKEQYPKLVWQGGIRVGDFEKGVTLGDNKNFNIYLLSASRGIKSFYQTKQSGTLVINVYESEIYGTYRNLSTNSDSRVYILDANGKMISGSSKANLGRHKDTFVRMSHQYGSFTANDGKNEMHVIFYRMKDIGWTLCMEIPLSAYKVDIIKLRSIIFYMIWISLAIAVLFSLYWTVKLTHPIYTLVNGMRNLKHGNFGITIDKKPENELGLLIQEFNRMSGSIRELIDQNQKIENEKRNAEMRVLQAHINPHFIFNTLNMIKWMAISINASNIMESINALGNLIRPIFKTSVSLIPLGEELQYIDNYLTIMNNRYGEGIKLINNVGEEAYPSLVPRLLLQPIVENALQHGMEASRYKGIIQIDGRVERECLILRIQDDGVGFEPEKLKALQEQLQETGGYGMEESESKGIGLLNVHNRIRLHYGDDYGLLVESGKEEGTTVMLRLPFIVQNS